ncbi:MAG: nucleotide exchange factor GrpE [Candidatus Doudnabacteria bacterium]
MTDQQQDEPKIVSPEEQIAELTANWKRTAADFENYRKRKEAESKELFEFAKEMAVIRLMPSLQSLEQVLFYAPEDEKYKDWLTGLRATIQQLEKSMEELGVVKIKTVGEKFDPTRHEAVEQIEGSEPGKIVKEIQPGFLLNNKVIIPAKVGVGKDK